jgi:hypothetical protein
MDAAVPLDSVPDMEPRSDLTAPENWPVPGWFKAAADGEQKASPTQIKTYDAYFTHTLRSRYLELENEFRSVYGNYGMLTSTDHLTAQRIAELLVKSRTQLEQEQPNLLIVSHILDLAERFLVWIYPEHMLKVINNSVLARLEAARQEDSSLEWVTATLRKVASGDIAIDLGSAGALLDDALRQLNQKAIQNHISSGLQLERLTTLRQWGFILLLLFFLGTPFLTNPQVSLELHGLLLAERAVFLSPWLSALGVALIGAMGGFLSGLLQARSSKVTLMEYQEKMLKLQLKPVLGAILALILYTLLSWQILPGITLENTGSYLLLAFLSGFSERYFLRLLDLKTDEEGSSREAPADA